MKFLHPPLLQFFTLLIIGVSPAYASKGTIQELTPPVSNVTIHLNSARINHSQKASIKPGINKLFFSGLAATIVENSIRLENYGPAEFLSITHYSFDGNTDLLSMSSDFQDFIRQQKDSLLLLEKSINLQKLEIAALEMEKKLLLSNDQLMANGRQISALELKAAIDFYKERYKSISTELFNQQEVLNKLLKNKIKLLKSIFNVKTETTNDVSISLIAVNLNNTGTEYGCQLNLSYVAAKAGWIPVYDIHAGNTSLKINYRVKVLNNSGIDWLHVPTTISTADPLDHYTAPDLDPLYISRQNRYKTNEVTEANQVKENTEDIYIPDHEISFKIPKTYAIRTGNIVFMNVTSYDLNPTILYRCVPKIDEQVYMIAKVKDWEQLNLLDGEATIYFNEEILGKSYIRPSELEEFLELPLGVVNNVYVKYKLANEYSSRKVLANEVVASFTYNIKIKNTDDHNKEIEIFDQIPVSEESSVKSELLEITDGGELDKESGKITWKLTLSASSEKNISLKYAVTYPRKRGYGLSKSYQKRTGRASF